MPGFSSGVVELPAIFVVIFVRDARRLTPISTIFHEGEKLLIF
jgi:hypothetical protein